MYSHALQTFEFFTKYRCECGCITDFLNPRTIRIMFPAVSATLKINYCKNTHYCSLCHGLEHLKYDESFYINEFNCWWRKLINYGRGFNKGQIYFGSLCYLAGYCLHLLQASGKLHLVYILRTASIVLRNNLIITNIN